MKDFSGANEYPLLAAAGLFSKVGIGWNLSEKLLYFWPFAILSLAGPWLLARHVLHSRWWALLSVPVFAGNTYILLVSRSQMTIATAEAIACIVLLAVVRCGRSTSLGQAIIAGLLFGLEAVYDLRIAYITLLISALYWTVIIAYDRNRPLLGTRLIQATLIGVAFLTTQLFWLTPLIFYRGEPGLPFASSPWIAFMGLGHGVTGLHPFWSGAVPSDFRSRPLNPAFFLIPMIAFIALLRRRVNAEVLWLSLSVVLAAFLIKQDNPPLGQIYDWMFAHFPGWNLFREASKLFVVVAIGYAVLVPAALRGSLKRSAGWPAVTLTSFAVGAVILLTSTSVVPLLRGQLAYATVPTPEPLAFGQLSARLNQDASYGAVLWFGGPVILTTDSIDHTFSIGSVRHPIVGLNGELQRSDPFSTFCTEQELPYCYMTGDLFTYLAESAGAGYVVSPIGSHVGSLPQAVDRSWLLARIESLLGPYETIGNGDSALALWRLPHDSPVVQTNYIAMVQGGPESTAASLPAVRALNHCPIVYREGAIVGPSADPQQGMILVVPRIAGAYASPTSGEYVIFAKSRAPALTLRAASSEVKAPRIPMAAEEEWSPYGPVHLSEGLTQIATSTFELGPAMAWNSASETALRQPSPQGPASGSLGIEEVSLKLKPDAGSWVELKRTYDAGWHASVASDHWVGDHLFNLYRLKATGSRDAQVEITFSTRSQERLGILLSLGFVALGAIVAFILGRARMQLPPMRIEAVWARGVARQLTLAGIVLLGVSALAEASSWFGIPSLFPSFPLPLDPYGTSDQLLLTALILLGVSILLRLTGRRAADPVSRGK